MRTNILSDFNYNSIHTTENWVHFVKSMKELPGSNQWKLANNDTANLLSSELLYNTYKKHPEINKIINPVLYPDIDDIFKLAQFKMTTKLAAVIPTTFGSPIIITENRSLDFTVDCIVNDNVNYELNKISQSKWQIQFLPWRQLGYKKGLLIATSEYRSVWIAFIKTLSIIDMLDAKRINYDRELLTPFITDHNKGDLQ